VLGPCQLPPYLYDKSTLMGSASICIVSEIMAHLMAEIAAKACQKDSQCTQAAVPSHLWEIMRYQHYKADKPSTPTLAVEKARMRAIFWYSLLQLRLQ